MAIGLTYAALMAYRFIYEEGEKRKVKSIFGQYLKPELVENMARARSVEDIPIGGERRELTLLFVDIRGFTKMSEEMEPQDVLRRQAPPPRAEDVFFEHGGVRLGELEPLLFGKLLILGNANQQRVYLAAGRHGRRSRGVGGSQRFG